MELHVTCVYVCAQCVQLFVIPWTTDRQALPSLSFSRQEYWSGLHSLLHRIFLTQGSNPGLLPCRRILYCLSHQGNPYVTWGFPNLKSVWELDLKPRQAKIKNKSVPLTDSRMTEQHWGSLVSFAWKSSFIKLPCQGRIFRGSQGSWSLISVRPLSKITLSFAGKLRATVTSFV